VCVSLATLLTALLFAPFRRHLVGSQAKSKKKTMSCDQPLFTKTSRGPVSLVECHFILKNVWSFGFSKRHCRDGETDRRPNQSFFMFSFSMPPHCFLDGPVSVATPSRSGEKKQKRFCCSTSVPLSLWPHTHTHTHTHKICMWCAVFKDINKKEVQKDSFFKLARFGFSPGVCAHVLCSHFSLSGLIGCFIIGSITRSHVLNQRRVKALSLCASVRATPTKRQRATPAHGRSVVS